MKQIFAKFNSKCAETGKTLRKGDLIFYDYSTRKAYHVDSEAVRNDKETNDTKNYINAQEEAYWDNLTGGYYSR
jgi:hypothetical protein